MFSHMAVMYAYGLYRRGFVREGHRVLDSIYRHAQDLNLSRMYPGIPEYVNSRGRGSYTYLTGSASWYLLTTLTQVFGVRGRRGDMALDPKLVRAQFDAAGQAGVVTLFAGKRLNVVYHNPAGLDCGEYRIGDIQIDGQPAAFRREAGLAVLPREAVAALADDGMHRVDVKLDPGKG